MQDLWMNLQTSNYWIQEYVDHVFFDLKLYPLNFKNYLQYSRLLCYMNRWGNPGSNWILLPQQLKVDDHEMQ